LISYEIYFLAINNEKLRYFKNKKKINADLSMPLDKVQVPMSE